MRIEIDTLTTYHSNNDILMTKTGGRGKREEGRGKREEGRGKREETREKRSASKHKRAERERRDNSVGDGDGSSEHSRRAGGGLET